MNNQEKTEKETNTPKLIGKGAYGYIHYPALKLSTDISLFDNAPRYKDQIDYDNCVSKLTKKTDAEKEMRHHELLIMTDPSCHFHLGMPIMGKPCLADYRSILKCVKNYKNNQDEWRLIIMPYGGHHIGHCANKIRDTFLTSNQMHVSYVHQMWIESYRLIYAISEMLKCGVVHHDIKYQNVLYDDVTTRMNLIDLNLMREFDEIKKEANEPGGYYLAIFHFNLPPEIFLYYKQEFENIIQFDVDRCQQFIDKIYLPDVKFGLMSSSKQVSPKDDFLTPDEMDEENFLNSVFFMIDRDERTIRELDDMYMTYMKTKDEIRQEGSFSRADATEPSPRKKRRKEQNQTEEVLPLREYMVKNFCQFLTNDIMLYSFDEFLNYSIKTIDIYGLGMMLLHVLVRTWRFLPKQFVIDIYGLIRRMIDANVHTRIQIDTLMEEYFDLLDYHFDLDEELT